MGCYYHQYQHSAPRRRPFRALGTAPSRERRVGQQQPGTSERPCRPRVDRDRSRLGGKPSRRWSSTRHRGTRTWRGRRPVLEPAGRSRGSHGRSGPAPRGLRTCPRLGTGRGALVSAPGLRQSSASRTASPRMFARWWTGGPGQHRPTAGLQRAEIGPFRAEDCILAARIKMPEFHSNFMI